MLDPFRNWVRQRLNFAPKQPKSSTGRSWETPTGRLLWELRYQRDGFSVEAAKEKGSADPGRSLVP
jgi:hypothetical protein